MSNKKAYSDEDRHSPDRYTDDFESDDGKRTSTPKQLSSPKKTSNHQYYQDKFRGRGKHSGTLKIHNHPRGLKRGRANNSRSSEPADIRKSHDNITSRVLSASRNRINELRNKVEELNIQVRDLQQENRLFKKLQFRQEKAIRVFEDKENDLPSLLDRHNNEVRALREQNRRLKEKFEKSDRYLRDAEDELEKMKMKLKRYKDICEQQELKEREDLSRKLSQAELDLEEKETKLKELQKYVDMLKKNHRHELGIEVARQKEMRKQVEELTERNSQLTNQLKEKEKALDYLNIYSNPQQGRPSRDNSPDGSTLAFKSKKKQSATSELTPREKAKFYAEKRRLELLKQKELKEEKERKKREQWEKEEREKEEREKEKNIFSSSSQQFVFGNKDLVFDEKEENDRLDEEKRRRQDRQNNERREEEFMKKQREFEKSQEQEHSDRTARENKDMKEREEKEIIERKRREEKERREQKDREERAKREVEKRVQEERERKEEEERKKERERKERVELERREVERVEQERRVQMEKEKMESDQLWQMERKKKDELLKKLHQMSEPGGADADAFSSLSTNKNHDLHLHTAEVKDVSISQGHKNESKEYSFSQPINNLHRGKPAHDDVTVPYLERQKQRRRISGDSGGYEPSFGPTREGNRTSNTIPASQYDDDDKDEPLFKLPANNVTNSATKQNDKKSTNLLETLFGPHAKIPDKTATNRIDENDKTLSRKPQNSYVNQIKSGTTNSQHPRSDPLSNKSRSDFDKKSTIFGGGALIEDEFPSNNSKVLPRRHRESNLNTFSAKPSVTAIDAFDDEIEEFVL